MVLFAFFFFLHGLISILSQVVVLRELTANLFGNELFIGVVLGVWLLGGGLGSLFGARVFKKINCFFLQFFVFFLLPLLPLLTRAFMGRLLLPGEIPSFFLGVLFVLFLLLPFCFLLDSLFPLGIRAWGRKNLSLFISRAYFFETVGIASGGLLFNFLLATSTFPLPSNLNKKTLAFRYQNLVEAVNSRYGSIVVTKTGNQYNFYENGAFLGANEDREGGEYLIHTVFSFHLFPKRVLLIGGGLNGPLLEILKYQTVEEIDFVELDPKLVEIKLKYLPPSLVGAVKDKRVKTHFLDGRRFLKEAKKKYDIVLLNLPNPSTALLNRFYTKECFEEVKRILAKNGLFSFHLSIPVDYLSEEGKNLAASIDKTVKTTFSHTLILPNETTILFLASEKPLHLKEGFKIKTSYFTPQYLSYRLKSKKREQISALLATAEAKINQDFSPAGYFYQNTFWQTMESFKSAKIFREGEKIDWFPFTLLVLLILAFLKGGVADPILSMALASFTLMTVEVLLIFLFQARLGYIYSKIALLFTTILVSLGGGNLFATRFKGAKRSLTLVKILVVIFLGIFFFFVKTKNFDTEAKFYLLGGAAGVLVGTVFPLTNRLYLKTIPKPLRESGVLYASDLFGAFFGAILPSLFFIPLFGVEKTILFLIILNLFFLLIGKGGKKQTEAV